MIDCFTLHQRHVDISRLIGKKCNRLDPSYQHHLIFIRTGQRQLHSHPHLHIITLVILPAYRASDQFNTSEATAPYITAREIILERARRSENQTSDPCTSGQCLNYWAAQIQILVFITQRQQIQQQK